MKKVSLDISKEKELSETIRSFPVLYDKSRKGFRENPPAKYMFVEYS